ncbi:hypothetical protein CEY12_17130 [Chryseobacterium sp. T16E-39]|uniref:hypothetical protein n=1 Tax=Chryseobacterium sp. T16E-39 TaxID=2015076 RepID=UPI000B5B42F9|nr:hypothetical protein [Chryseobacterium sp. T16E-39]ASK31731.1 hypothetical protein CEY12_17130 [Chryseobacterium sp. T16E-39]
MSRFLAHRITLIFLLICNSFICQNKNKLEYQNDVLIQNLGNGLVQFLKTNEKITLYSDKNLLKIEIKDAQIGNNLIPLLNKPDYGILFFPCIEKGSDFYKIIISKNHFAYIKSSKDIMYYTWKDFLLNQVTSITSKNLDTNPPRTSIGGKVINIENWTADDEVSIIKVDRNWIQVKNITQNNQLFWIEWKDDRTLKIFLNLLI